MLGEDITSSTGKRLRKRLLQINMWFASTLHAGAWPQGENMNSNLDKPDNVEHPLAELIVRRLKDVIALCAIPLLLLSLLRLVPWLDRVVSDLLRQLH